jgi:hypothetical protein
MVLPIELPRVAQRLRLRRFRGGSLFRSGRLAVDSPAPSEAAGHGIIGASEVDFPALRHSDDRTHSGAQTASSHHSLYCGSSPRTARVYTSAMASVLGPGHGIERSSTELTALISAAVPQTNISSAM